MVINKKHRSLFKFFDSGFKNSNLFFKVHILHLRSKRSFFKPENLVLRYQNLVLRIGNFFLKCRKLRLQIDIFLYDSIRSVRVAYHNVFSMEE